MVEIVKISKDKKLLEIIDLDEMKEEQKKR